MTLTLNGGIQKLTKKEMTITMWITERVRDMISLLIMMRA
jgi:hypothetical protein